MVTLGRESGGNRKGGNFNNKIKIREIKSADIKEVLVLHNVTYGENRTEEEWIWEYKSNYPDLFVFAVVEAHGSVVGTLGMIPIYLNIKGERHLSGKGENALMHPQYRGGALFQELSQFVLSLCKKKNMLCRWGFTPAADVWRHKLGFRIYDRCFYESLLVLDFKRALSRIAKSDNKILGKISLFFLIIFSYSYSLICRAFIAFFKKTPKRIYSIEYNLRSIKDLEALYSRLREKYPGLIHIEQDEKYILWRISTNPSIRYKTYFVYEKNSLVGYSYVGINNEHSASLTDFTFENQEAGISFLSSLIRDLRHEKIDFIRFQGNAKNSLMKIIFRLLRKFGFVRRKTTTPFVLRNILYEDENYLYDIKYWYINILWTEGFDF